MTDPLHNHAKNVLSFNYHSLASIYTFTTFMRQDINLLFTPVLSINCIQLWLCLFSVLEVILHQHFSSKILRINTHTSALRLRLIQSHWNVTQKNSITDDNQTKLFMSLNFILQYTLITSTKVFLLYFSFLYYFLFCLVSCHLVHKHLSQNLRQLLTLPLHSLVHQLQHSKVDAHKLNTSVMTDVFDCILPATV